MGPRSLASVAVVVVVLGTSTAVTTTRRAASTDVSACGTARASATDVDVASFDDVSIATTVFRPQRTCARRPAPAVIATHGWGGSRWTPDVLGADTDAGRHLAALLDDGYSVVSVDLRGHGASGGTSTFHEPTVELRDVSAVIDMVASLDWVASDGASDPTVAILGASYGGALALLVAAFDARVDAIVPMVTWNELERSLAPNGVVNSRGVGALATSPTVRTAKPLGSALTDAVASRELSATLVRTFERANPGRWIDQIDVPTFLVQGFRDRLFPVNEALETLTALRDRDVDVWLVAAQIGHVEPDALPTLDGILPRDCALWTGRRAITTFLDATLRADAEAVAHMRIMPPITFATEQGRCVTTGTWPPHEQVRLAVGGELVGRTALFTATERTTLVGVPRFEGTLAAGAEAHMALVHDHGPLSLVLGGGGTDVRADDEGSIAADLYAFATTLEPGDILWLDTTGCDCVPEGTLEIGVLPSSYGPFSIGTPTSEPHSVHDPS